MKFTHADAHYRIHALSARPTPPTPPRATAVKSSARDNVVPSAASQTINPETLAPPGDGLTITEIDPMLKNHQVRSDLTCFLYNNADA